MAIIAHVAVGMFLNIDKDSVTDGALNYSMPRTKTGWVLNSKYLDL